MYLIKGKDALDSVFAYVHMPSLILYISIEDDIDSVK